MSETEINEDNCVLNDRDLIDLKIYLDGVVNSYVIKSHVNYLYQKITKLNDLAKEKGKHISKMDEAYRAIWGMPLTWRCCVCGKERPDDKISVFTTDIPWNKGGEINIKFCNDNNECFKKAPILAKKLVT